MSEELVNKESESLFEQIKHIDENGVEYWQARQLSKTLGYSDFRNFTKVLQKAAKACQQSKQELSDHLVEFDEVIDAGKGAKQSYPSYKLSRYFCYLIVQNADSSKEVVTLGQTYFAVQTRNMSTLITNESKYSISQYGMDMPIDALYKRLKDEDIIIPNFQRGYVWKQNEASRFIETILLRLPVPSIFLAKDKYTQKLIVVDGQQRLKTIMYFIDGEFQNGKKFELSKVIDEYIGLGFDDLSMADRREFLNTIVHAIVIYEDEESNAIYDIFERINTSGSPLHNQEIRKAVYHGPFDSLITELNNGNELWREMYGGIDDRRRDEEAILRGVALSFELDSYDGKMKDFLNVFMLHNRVANDERLDEFKRIFDKTIEVIYDKIGKDAFRANNKRFSMALLDSIFPAVAINLLEGKEIVESLSNTVNEITGSGEFQEFMGGSANSRKSMSARIHLLKNQIGV